MLYTTNVGAKVEKVLKFMQGIPIKVTEFKIEIPLEIFGVGNQFRYVWKAETCSYLAG